MKNIIYSLLLLSLFNSCFSNKNENEIAIINGYSIVKDQIDSVASLGIYENRKQALKVIIKKNVVKCEAKKRGISENELIKIEVENKADNVILYDYEKYLELNNITREKKDSIKIIAYLKTIKIKQRHDTFIDSLIQNSEIKIFLNPTVYKTIELNDIKSFDLTPENDLIVYIISDYDCPTCQFIEPKLNKIIENYKNKVNFRYVYFSEYISKKALASYAAATQNHFIEMYKHLHSKNKEISDEEIFEIAEDLGLDFPTFEMEYSDSNTLRQFLVTKEELIKKGVYSTPTIIINSKVLDDELAIYTLENVIENELH